MKFILLMHCIVAGNIACMDSCAIVQQTASTVDIQKRIQQQIHAAKALGIFLAEELRIEPTSFTREYSRQQLEAKFGEGCLEEFADTLLSTENIIDVCNFPLRDNQLVALLNNGLRIKEWYAKSAIFRLRIKFFKELLKQGLTDIQTLCKETLE